MSEDSSSETSENYGTAAEFLELFEALVVKELPDDNLAHYIDFAFQCMQALDGLLAEDEYRDFFSVHDVVYCLLEFHFELGRIEDEPPQVPPALSNYEADQYDDDTCIHRYFIRSTWMPNVMTNSMHFFDRIYRNCLLMADMPIEPFVNLMVMHGLGGTANLVLPNCMRDSWVGTQPEFSSALEAKKREGEAVDGGTAAKRQRRHSGDTDALDSNTTIVDPKDAIILALQGKLITLEDREKQFLSLSASWQQESESLKGEIGALKTVNEELTMTLEKRGQKDTFDRLKSLRDENCEVKAKLTRTSERLRKANLSCAACRLS